MLVTIIMEIVCSTVPAANRCLKFLYIQLSGWLAHHASNLSSVCKASQSEAKGDFSRLKNVQS
jgi:hypothetical protein